MKKLYTNLAALVVASAMSTAVSAQCDFGGTNYGNVTPVVSGAPVLAGEVLGFPGQVWGGDQYTLNVIAGDDYTVTFCSNGGGSPWDTMITIFDENQNVVASSDDACDLNAEVSFNAGSSGAYTIQINEYFCEANETDGADVAIIWYSNVGGCEFAGTNYGNITPASPNTPYLIGEMLGFPGQVWGGDQYTLDVNAGDTYRISFCADGGTSPWDTEITVFNQNNVPVAYMDDVCNLNSEVEFYAASSGAYTVQINEYSCASNETDGADASVIWFGAGVNVEEVETAVADFNVFPNPASSNITIEPNFEVNGQFQIDIIDLTGKLVRSETSNGTATISVSELPAGLYSVQLVSDLNRVVKRVVIQH